MKNICVIGTGYVGLVTGVCFADLGNNVVCIDIDPQKIEMLQAGKSPIYEPGLEELLERNLRAGRLCFTDDYAAGLQNARFVFITVGTPMRDDGAADLQYVEAAARGIGQHLTNSVIIIDKSTVPVGTGDVVGEIVSSLAPQDTSFAVVSNPEFLREGSAMSDFFNPDRIVLGSTNREAAEQVAELHAPLHAPIIITDLRTAEMIKYASNAFLATRISFINEIAQICEKLGADVKEVARGMGADKRIGPHFLEAGIGYGGSCFAADETVFTLNSPNVAAERIDRLFERGEAPFQGETVEVILPHDQRILAFDLTTGSPTLAEVKAITRRPYTGTMVTIQMSLGRSLRVTADHPVIIHANGAFTIVPAIAVMPGDQLCLLCALPDIQPAYELNLIELLTGSDLKHDLSVCPTDSSFTDQYDQFATAIPPEALRSPHEIRQYNRMPLSIFRQLREQGRLHVLPEKLRLCTDKGAATMLNAIIPVDADLLRLCGYYLAAGTISPAADDDDAAHPWIDFCFHTEETEYIADVQRILRCWGLEFTEQQTGESHKTLVSSRVFAWLLNAVLHCGLCSEDKALPRLAFNVTPDLRFELLRGAFSRDGAVALLRDSKSLALEYATVSKPLADGMALLLQTLGVVPAIHTRWIETSDQPAYILRVSGYEYMSILSPVFGEKHRTDIEQALAGYQSHLQPHSFRQQRPYANLTVQEVEYEAVQTTVYSMETSTGTLIASSGIISHNCFPKDVLALHFMAANAGCHPQLLQAVMDINRDARKRFVEKVQVLLGSLEHKQIGVLGLSFKPNTDDMREAPSIDIIQALQAGGAHIKAYDPVAMENADKIMPTVTFCATAYDVAKDADALLIVTEWNEFKQLDWERIRQYMRQPIVVDGRNQYDRREMAERGFIYWGVGRGRPPERILEKLGVTAGNGLAQD